VAEKQSPQAPASVALVLFQVGPYRAALEACHVLAMTEHPSTARAINAHSLLYQGGEHPQQPSRWLTLRDTQTASTWQLGVNGEITLQQLPAKSLYPMPTLLQSRHHSPALCGVTFVGQQLVLLLDANKLSRQHS
jgi:hypothetical protein